jgi:hypothetical protein
LIRWWIIPLTCVIIYILFAAFNLFSEALLLPTFVRYWWIIVPIVVVIVIMLFLAYRWANSDEMRERREPDPMERLIWGITGKRGV